MIINNDENHEIAWKINENKLQVHNTQIMHFIDIYYISVNNLCQLG